MLPFLFGERYCNAPRSMCQVSSSYSLLLPCHCLRVMHCISCHQEHFSCIHVRLMHPRNFPVVRFCNPALLCHPVSRSTSFHVRVLNVFGLDRDLSCGLRLLPVDRLSSFVPFGLHLILQRLTEGPKRPRVCCSPTPLPTAHLAQLTPSMLSVVRSRSRCQKPHLIWTLLAPSIYK